jgi:hypothetical protein
MRVSINTQLISFQNASAFYLRFASERAKRLISTGSRVTKRCVAGIKLPERYAVCRHSLDITYRKILDLPSPWTTLNIRETNSIRTSVCLCQSQGHYKTEDLTLHEHPCGNIKLQIILVFSLFVDAVINSN